MSKEGPIDNETAMKFFNPSFTPEKDDMNLPIVYPELPINTSQHLIKYFLGDKYTPDKVNSFTFIKGWTLIYNGIQILKRYGIEIFSHMEKENAKFEEKINSLMEMSNKDRDTVISALDRFNGDVEKAADKLLLRI